MDIDDFFSNEYDEPTGHDVDEEDAQEENDEREKYESDNETVGSLDDDKDPDKPEDEDEEELENEEEEEDKKEESKKKEKIIEPSKRITNPIMTKFEYSYIVAKRAEMIENGSPLMLPDTKEIKAIKIAMEETDAGLNPIIIRRTLPSGNVEEWKSYELRSTKNFI